MCALATETNEIVKLEPDDSGSNQTDGHNLFYILPELIFQLTQTPLINGSKIIFKCVGAATIVKVQERGDGIVSKKKIDKRPAVSVCWTGVTMVVRSEKQISDAYIWAFTSSLYCPTGERCCVNARLCFCRAFM